MSNNEVRDDEDTILDIIDAFYEAREKGDDDIEVVRRFAEDVVKQRNDVRDEELRKVTEYLKRTFGNVGEKCAAALRTGAHRR